MKTPEQWIEQNCYSLKGVTPETIRRIQEDASRPEHATTGALLIVRERRRQIEGEGHGADRDDRYINGELRDAAIAYAQVCDDRAGDNAAKVFPWSPEFWKPSDDPIRNMVKAGALAAAEVDRLLRKKSREEAANVEDLIKRCPRCGGPAMVDIEERQSAQNGRIWLYRVTCFRCGVRGNSTSIVESDFSETSCIGAIRAAVTFWNEKGPVA